MLLNVVKTHQVSNLNPIIYLVLLANICKKINILEVINLRISRYLKMSLKTLKFCCFIFAITCFYNCTTSNNKDSVSTTLFTSFPSSKTNIDFKNTVKEDLYFNFLNYPYIYNGGGVAIGDINNDGLEDIYFTANQNSNKLYLNFFSKYFLIF